MKTYFDLANEKYYEQNVCAFKNKKGLIELNSEIVDTDVTPIYLTDKDGLRIFERTCTFLMVVATTLLFNEGIIINHHMSGGYFGEFLNPNFDVKKNIGAIKEKMLQLIEAKLPITKETMSVSAAIDFFENNGMKDKSELIK